MPSYRQRFAAGLGRQGSQKSGKVTRLFVVQKEKGRGQQELGCTSGGMRRLRQPEIGEQLAFMSTRPEHSQGEEGMLNLLLGITALLATTSLTQAQTPLERGSYLVNGVLTCG